MDRRDFLDQGVVYAPEKAGLKYEIDWNLVKRETVQVAKVRKWGTFISL
jgi:hypothetical protein